MYRTIIVDDEQWALVGIRKFLERGSEHFHIIHETTNPMVALRMIQREQPDIVFTDIRMPELSGIDLIQKTREQQIPTEFVIISGFSEFAYAQQAIRAGALDYLLKPLDVANAQTILQKIEQQLAAHHKMDDLTLYSAINNETASVAELLRPYYAYDFLPCWQAATVILSDTAVPPVEIQVNAPHQLLTLRMGPRKLVYLINCTEGAQEAIHAAFCAQADQMDSCGFSPMANDIQQLPHLLRLAEFAMFDRFVQPDQKVFRFRAAQNSRVFDIWQRISRELQVRKSDSLKCYFASLPDLFKAQGLTTNDALALWNLIAEDLPSRLPRTDALDDIIPLKAYSLVEKFSDLHAMCQYLAEQLSPQTDVRDGSAYQHFQMLLRHVDERYMDNLNLQDLCDRFYINVSYCCELFRKETKLTFTQYITRLRMGHARQLLTTTTLPLKEICDRIGYNDYFYFDKVFKKHVGCTPSEYRRREEGGSA